MLDLVGELVWQCSGYKGIYTYIYIYNIYETMINFTSAGQPYCHHLGGVNSYLASLCKLAIQWRLDSLLFTETALEQEFTWELLRERVMPITDAI